MLSESNNFPFFICQRPPSVAASDVTQYEEIDDIDLIENNLNIQSRPLPAPPRPPREKRRSRKRSTNSLKKFYDDTNDNILLTSSEFDGAEISTQTEPLAEANVNVDTDARTVAEILRENNLLRHSNDASDESLTRGIQKFREANQRSYSERSRTSGDRPRTPLSRPITPSAILIEQRVTRSPIQTDATLIVRPFDRDDLTAIRTDSAESGGEYVPSFIDDDRIDTEDERIISAAIRRYQMLDTEDSLDSPSPSPRQATLSLQSSEEAKTSPVKNYLGSPTPPPRRKSSASTRSNITPTSSIAESEHSEPKERQLTPVNDLSVSNLSPQRSEETLQSMNIVVDTQEMPEENPVEDVIEIVEEVHVSEIQIAPDVMQAIVNRPQTDSAQREAGREPTPRKELTPQRQPTPPIESTPQKAPSPPKEEQKGLPSKTQPEPEATSIPKIEPVKIVETVVESKTIGTTESVPAREESPQPPAVPSLPPDYTLPSDIPDSFYQLRSGISDEDSRTTSMPLPPPTARQRSRKHHKRSPAVSSSSDDDDHRRHHHGAHASRAPETSVGELSGQLIRACGRALNTTMNSAGNALLDVIRGVTQNQDEKQKDISLVLVILIVIVATLMMLGMSADRSVHHHHWDYLNPPDHFGRK